jgi:hypothetical protein
MSFGNVSFAGIDDFRSAKIYDTIKTRRFVANNALSPSNYDIRTKLLFERKSPRAVNIGHKTGADAYYGH